MIRRPLIGALMMYGALGLVFMLPTAGRPATGDTTNIDAIINKYIQASGGTALRDFRTERRTGTLLRYKAGQVPLEMTAKAPGLWRYDQTFAWGDQVSYGFDSKQAWVADMRSVETLNPDQLFELQLLADPQAPLKMRDWYPQMTMNGAEKVGQKEAHSILARSAAGRTTELALDKESGLLLRAGQLYFEDYHADGAVVRPHKILLGVTDSLHFQMVMQFSDAQYDVPLDDTRFGQPAGVLAATEAPLYTPRSQVELDIPALDACVGVYQHPTDTGVTYTVSRQGAHLMLTRTGWGIKMEIVPESDSHFYVSGREF